MDIKFQSEDKQTINICMSIEEFKIVEYLIRRRSKTIYEDTEIFAQNIEPLLQNIITESTV